MTERDTLVQLVEKWRALAASIRSSHQDWSNPYERGVHDACIHRADELAAALAVVPLLEPQQEHDDLTRIGQPDADPPPQHASTDKASS
jgi:hypothetical protein